MSLLPTINARGLLASRPAAAAANEGYLYYGTDTGILYRSNGSSWDTNSSGFANPMTTSGDIIYGGASGTPTRLPKGTDGQVLTLASGIPSWAAATGGGGGSFIGCRVRRTTDQSLTLDTLTAILFDTEDFDTDTMHSTVSNTDRITASTAGYYAVGAYVSWSAGGNKQAWMSKVTSGPTFTTIVGHDGNLSAGTDGLSYMFGTVIYLAVGDYIITRAFSGGGSGTLKAQDGAQAMWAYKVG